MMQNQELNGLIKLVTFKFNNLNVTNTNMLKGEVNEVYFKVEKRL